MSFDPGLELGDKITNADVVKIFACGNMGGMRRSKKTGTLVIISDETKGLYRDEWQEGILYYTGMGKVGNQVLNGNQNGTLFYSNSNGVEVHLFEVMEKTVYTYRGVVVLAREPYQTRQPDDHGNMRDVWIFLLKLVDTFEKKIKEAYERDIVKLPNKELGRRFEINASAKGPKKAETTVYYRNPYLKALVKRLAMGKCQWCKAEAPFIDNYGEPYLEEHHVQELANGGKDEIDNVVAVCPNCHRKIHILNKDSYKTELKDIALLNKQRYERMMTYSSMSAKNNRKRG